MKPATLPTPIYGSFECHPARFTDYEAWVLFGTAWRELDSYEELFGNPWREFNAAEVLRGAGIMTKEKFETTWGALPPLPKHAFTKLPKPELKARIDDVNARARALYGKVLENYSPEWREAFGLKAFKQQKPQAKRRLSPAEKRIIAFVEQTSGRKLTEQEIYLSLEQARALGEL
jgi:hypothetical protein